MQVSPALNLEELGEQARPDVGEMRNPEKKLQKAFQVRHLRHSKTCQVKEHNLHRMILSCMVPQSHRHKE